MVRVINISETAIEQAIEELKAEGKAIHLQAVADKAGFCSSSIRRRKHLRDLVDRHRTFIKANKYVVTCPYCSARNYRITGTSEKGDKFMRRFECMTCNDVFSAIFPDKETAVPSLIQPRKRKRYECGEGNNDRTLKTSKFGAHDPRKRKRRPQGRLTRSECLREFGHVYEHLKRRYGVLTAEEYLHVMAEGEFLPEPSASAA